MRSLILTAVLLSLGFGQAAETTYYVAPTGRDNWSGRLAAPNQAQTDGPCATLSRARDVIRQSRANGELPGPVTVQVRGGLYCLPETLTFGPEDAGTAEAPITYRAYPGESPVLSGGTLLAGWKETTGGGVRRWTVTLPAVRNGSWNFRQLFTRQLGEPVWQRRYRPLRGMMAVADLTWSPARKTAPHRAAQQDFICFPGDLEPWENLGDVELVALHSWSASRLKIESLDTEKRIVRLTSVPTFRIGSWYKDERNPYYVENLKADLREPGQWYLDRPTGVLTYLPLKNERLSTTQVMAPRLERLLTIQGDLSASQFVEHLRFVGLSFAHSEWPLPTEGYDVSQGQPALSAAVEVTAARSVSFSRCLVAHTGAYGVGLGLGCHGCEVIGCLMYDLGGGGVKVGQSSMKRTMEYPVLPTGNRVENNTITHTGLVHYSANGIWCGVVRGTRIRHNLVRFNPYTGIAVGWCWDANPSSCGDNLIERNHVHDVMQLVQDGGGIYTLGRQPGTVIRGNLLHDNQPSPFACDEGQCGLYFDQGSSGFLVEDNIQYHIAWTENKLVQNQNTSDDHDIRANYLGVKPEAPAFPRAIAAQAGVEQAYRWPQADKLLLAPNPVHAMKLRQYPDPPPGFAHDFEEVPVGEAPRKFSRAGMEANAYLGVTEETGRNSRRCLKFEDAPGLSRVFYPYLQARDLRVPDGPVEFSFDLMRPAAKPGRLWVELRDYQTGQQEMPYWAGPSLGFLPDGQVLVDKQVVATVAPGQWVHVAVRFALGAGQPPIGDLTLTLEDGTKHTAPAPYLKPEFRTLTSVVLSADADAAGVVYVDNLVCKVGE